MHHRSRNKMKTQQTIPIVQQDLTHEETIVQIAFSLEALEKVVSNVFSNVECAIERKKKRLNNIQGRCEIAKQKVEKLMNVNKSIKVFSCYKYPCPSNELFYKDPLCRTVEINEPIFKVKCSTFPPDKLSIKEKFKFYHVRDNTHLIKRNWEPSSLEGLGPLPSDYTKINTLLLYNTNQNLYKNYKIVNPLTNVNKQIDTNNKKNNNVVLDPDPISVGLSDTLGYKNIHNYFYSPSVQDVPDIEAPLNLPRLTGIAGDLKYNCGHNEEVKAITNVEAVIQLNDDIPKKEILEVDNILSSPQPSAPLPPPPPVPPPLPSIYDDIENESKTASTKLENSVSIDVRANLMEAIRQAGGKSKLKHVNCNKLEPSIPKSKSLMDDLHEKLHMRRKGISGKIDNTDGMLDRIVSMIPPPPAPSKQIEDDDDEDWDD